MADSSTIYDARLRFWAWYERQITINESTKFKGILQEVREEDPQNN